MSDIKSNNPHLTGGEQRIFKKNISGKEREVNQSTHKQKPKIEKYNLKNRTKNIL